METLGAAGWGCWGMQDGDTRAGGTCAFLADVGQVVVAGHVVPLADLVGHQHHAVLAARKEVVGLVLPPVLVLLVGHEGVRPPVPPTHTPSPPLHPRGSHQAGVVGPLEILLHDPVVEPNPGVFMPKTYGEKHARLAR